MSILDKSSNYSIFFVLPLSVYIWYIFYNYLTEFQYMSAVWIVNFAIHELWHPLFWIFWNQTWSVAWWTLLQLIIPIAVLIWFLRQKDYYWVSVVTAWIWTNLFYISMYSWDAVKMKLPLMSLWWWNWDIIHDWFYLFTKAWVISYTDEISGFFKILAIICFIIYFLYTIVLVKNRFSEWKI